MGFYNNVIDGRKISESLLSSLAKEIPFLKTHNISPKLAIVIVGENPASQIYVNRKLTAAERTGIATAKVALPSGSSTESLQYEIQKLNNDPSISGIIVQLPLPQHIDYHSILSSIHPDKDVDGFHPLNVGYLNSGSDKGFVPCTPLACRKLITQYEPNLSGKHVVVVGRSNIVGKPLASLLLRDDCTVTICHSHTKNISNITFKADIVILAIGKPQFFGVEYFNPNSIVIDVGINRREGTTKIVGDVDFSAVQDKVKWITPVPGGVGPMTVACLMQNTILAAKRLLHDVG